MHTESFTGRGSDAGWSHVLFHILLWVHIKAPHLVEGLLRGGWMDRSRVGLGDQNSFTLLPCHRYGGETKRKTTVSQKDI